MSNIILGFDVSSTKTGFSILKNGRFTKSTKDFGSIEIDSKLSLSEKLVYFRDSVEEVINRYNPQHIVIEDVFIGHKSTIILLSRFSGVIIELCKRICVEPCLINATKARSLLKVKNKKEEAFKFIKDKYKLNWEFKTHNDIADSLVLVLAYKKLISV